MISTAFAGIIRNGCCLFLLQGAEPAGCGDESPDRSEFYSKNRKSFSCYEEVIKQDHPATRKDVRTLYSDYEAGADLGHGYAQLERCALFDLVRVNNSRKSGEPSFTDWVAAHAVASRDDAHVIWVSRYRGIRCTTTILTGIVAGEATQRSLKSL